VQVSTRISPPALADTPSDNRALTSLDIGRNHLVGEKGTGRCKTVAGFDSDESDEEEEIIEPECSGIIALADAIKDMRSLTKLIFGGGGVKCDESTDWCDVPFEPATLEVGMTRADFSNKNLGVEGAIVISAWISHKEKGALLQLHVAQNKFGVEGTRFLCDSLGLSARCVAEWFDLSIPSRYIWSIKCFLWLVQWLLPQSHCDLLLSFCFLQIV
jgi:hypothetical protein